MAVKFSNNAFSTLGGSINAGVTSFSVGSASTFPALGGSDHMFVTVGSEVVKVTAINSNTFTCIATSASHSAGDNVELRVTAETLNDFHYVHPNHSGDVVSSSDGAQTIAADAVTYAKMQNVSATNKILGRDSSGAGVVEEITPANLRTMINVEDGATADQSNSEIVAAVEAGSDSNTFTDADHTKLNGITASANAYVHPNHSGEVTSTADGATVIAGNVVDEANLKVSNDPSNGYFLSAQSGATGGMTWAEVDALPSQSGNSGKFLTTDATNASWAVLDTDANTTTKGLYEHAHTIAANYSIASGNNAFSSGHITINSNVSVTVASGSTWTIA